jgi:hypothetical protein
LRQLLLRAQLRSISWYLLHTDKILAFTVSDRNPTQIRPWEKRKKTFSPIKQEDAHKAAGFRSSNDTVGISLHFLYYFGSILGQVVSMWWQR